MIPLTELYGQAIERLKEENPAFLLGLEPRIHRFNERQRQGHR